MNLKRKQIFNCCTYLHYLDIVDKNFTLDNYRWLNNFKYDEVFKSYSLELSKNEKEMLQEAIEQIKLDHAEEVKIYDEEIHKKAVNSLRKLGYAFSLFGDNYYSKGFNELMR